MYHRIDRPPAATSRASRVWRCTSALIAAMLCQAPALAAQGHEHASHAPVRDAQLDLVLGGPHLILYHRGYLALGDEQVTGLQRLRRAVCEAAQGYVEQTATWRGRLRDVLDHDATLTPTQVRTAAKPSRLDDAVLGIAAAESQWLTALMHARRDALALLTAAQRTQLSALRDHWAREAVVMIEEATRPGQRGHPGTQLPIRVPGMVVHTTTLLPHCEALHGPSRHIVIPPPS